MNQAPKIQHAVCSDAQEPRPGLVNCECWPNYKYKAWCTPNQVQVIQATQTQLQQWRTAYVHKWMQFSIQCNQITRVQQMEMQNQLHQRNDMNNAQQVCTCETGSIKRNIKWYWVNMMARVYMKQICQLPRMVQLKDWNTTETTSDCSVKLNHKENAKSKSLFSHGSAMVMAEDNIKSWNCMNKSRMLQQWMEYATNMKPYIYVRHWN